MKKLLVCLVVLAFLLVPAMAMAYNDGQDLPSGATEQTHWEWNPDKYGVGVGGWDEYKAGNTAALARCWTSGGGLGYCNKEKWNIAFTHHASMAQWCNWTMSGTRWDWRILKPGTYAADCISVWLQSNNDVKITFAGFGDLEYMLEDAGVKRTIDTYYSWGSDLESTPWIRAINLNEEFALIGDSEALHEGLSTKLWNKIFVENCNSSCEYENSGTITIALQNIKRWVDPQTGGWK
ncbi:MAG TPA: hypothetical protein GX721_09645 [Firmicutes bacterium]|jgi:hypothetical protein|nr:hypothetical protein [Bacillota bacterium]